MAFLGNKSMKVHVAKVYQPKEGEEISDQLSLFTERLSENLTALEDADVHIVYVTQGTEKTPEFEWITENAENVVAVVASKKYRHCAPKDFVWQECISLKHDKEVEELITKLKGDVWTPKQTKEERKVERNAKKAAREVAKLERAQIKAGKAMRKLQTASIQVMQTAVDGTAMEIEVPEGMTKLSLQLITTWSK